MNVLLPELIFGAAALLIVGLNLGFALVSFRENEPRAGRLALVSMAAALPWAVLVFIPDRIQTIVLLFMGGLVLIGSILFFLPLGVKKESAQYPRERIDERVIMFARMRLRPGSAEFKRYYELHPEHRVVDERIRQHPGLLSAQAAFSNPFMTAASEASFATVAQLSPLADGVPVMEKIPLSPQPATDFVLSLVRQYGALEAGVTRLQPYHIYSHIGRGEGQWGAEIELAHTFAIAFTVEMSAENMAAAPRQPVTLESARQYVNAGMAAVQLAESLRRMGYAARAHIDGNYRVICPLVARDAGLGEIGRMGILMTPHQGPRVRIGVVTTTLELIPHRYAPDESVFDFCSICKKCAENCPSQAIPGGARTLVNGALRWQIDQAACFEYWTRIGTDCGRCMAVCPYAHRDHWLHERIRGSVRRSAGFRHLALWADDLFYGRHPRPKVPPTWADPQG